MASEPLRDRLPTPLRRTLGAIRRFLDYHFRALMTGSFRAAVTLLRALHILPRPSLHRGPKRILIAHLTPHLGDTVLQMPLIAALRAAHPNARIEAAVEAGAAPLLERMPELDHVYALRLKKEPPVTIAASIHRTLQVCRRYWAHMRGCTPDICLLPRWDNDQYRSRVLAYLTGAPRRIGFTWDSDPGSLPAGYRDALLTEAIRAGSGIHEADRFCLLAFEAGLLPAPPSQLRSTTDPLPALQRIAAAVDWPHLASRLGIDTSTPFAVVAPGATMPRRVWPSEYWAEVCDAIESLGLKIVLLSGPSDAAIAQQVYEQHGRKALLLAGKTNLIESTAILHNAALFLGSESGPGHVAGALARPTVVLFPTISGDDPDEPTAPARIRPMGPLVKFCCPPENLPPCQGACVASSAHCITLIEPATVIEAAESVLTKAGHTPSSNRSVLAS